MPPIDKARRRLETIKLDRLAIEYVPPGSIQPNTYNPNRQAEHEFELLIRSMRDDGFTQPVICLRKTREIVDGEHRWRAALAIGYTEIPVVFVDMTPEQMRVSTLRHNRARGSEDAELAALVLADLQKIEDSVAIAESLGLSVSEIDQLVADFSNPQVLEDEAVRNAEASGDTLAIQDARRSAAVRIDQTRHAEGRVQEAIERDSYRVAITLTGPEAAIVKRVLGKEPARRLLELCREEIASNA